LDIDIEELPPLKIQRQIYGEKELYTETRSFVEIGNAHDTATSDVGQDTDENT
jgi:hypothetical protein